MILLRRGDIILADFAPARAAEVNYTRPAVVVTNNEANAHSPVITLVPMTSNCERIYPSELLLPLERTGLDRDGKVQIQLIRHVSMERILKVLGYVPEDLMLELDTKLLEHLALKR